MQFENFPQWDPNILNRHPLYAPFSPWQPYFEQHQSNWPTLAELQTIIAQQAPIRSHGGTLIHLVNQDSTALSFIDQYESRIYLKGEIQTRTHSWHDLFQVLVWCRFPATKVVLNKRHYQQSWQRNQHEPIDKRRTPIENALTLFDECGAIIVSCRPNLLTLVIDHDWETLFCAQRQTLKKEFGCFVFGHALHEKTVAPYIGMTAKAVFILVEPHFFNLSLPEQAVQLDVLVAQIMDAIQSPKELHPFPLLGIPGWHPDNESPEFYRNLAYFRPARN